MKKLITCLLLSVFVVMLIAQTEKRGVYMNDNLGIVFSGGGALGLAHIGAIKALEEYDLEPCYVAGSSMGAIIGVMYAAGYTSDEIMKIVEDRRLYKVGHLMSWQSAYWNQGMSTQKTLYKELREFVPHNSFDSLERRFMVCVTNVETGEPVYRHTGDNLKEFVAASASIPAVFEPIVIDSVRYVDGGVTDNLPVKALRAQLGLPLLKVIAIDVLPFIENYEAKNSLDMAKWGLRLFQYKNAEPNRATADYLIDCWALKEYHEFDFKRYKEIYQYGYDAMKAYIEANPTIKR
jgi:NTE family protein